MQKLHWKSIWHAFVRFLARLASLFMFRIRSFGHEVIPARGPGLLLSNHQSNLDPVLIGLATTRGLNYMARETLFRHRALGWLMRSLDGFPIDREGTGLGGVKETLRRLKQGQIVVLFPEGTRSRDGQVQAIKPGFCAMARRAGVTLYPAAIDGAFQAWPRQRAFPRRGVIHLCFGTPIRPAEIAAMSDSELLAAVNERIRDCHARAAESRRRSMGLACEPSQTTTE